MRSIKKKALACTAAIAAVALLFGTALAVGHARSEKRRYIQSELEMTRRDLCAAAEEMLTAIRGGDEAGLNRAAGKAEAYLSRAALGDCGEIYREIKRICAEGSEEDCQRLVDAVKEAAEGDGRALRRISGGEIPPSHTEEETTDDLLSSRMMKRLGNARDDVALRRAQAFACPNAEFDVCDTSLPYTFAYSGENVFVLVSGDTPRVMMYCFDREIDARYSVDTEDADRISEMIIKREKLRLGEKRETERSDGIYRTVFYGKGDLSDVPLVKIEIYSDTGRLRLYDAVNYYKSVT